MPSDVSPLFNFSLRKKAKQWKPDHNGLKKLVFKTNSVL